MPVMTPSMSENASEDVRNAARVERGSGPVILAAPHAGLYMPADMLSMLNDEGRTLRDADWRIDELYDGLAPDATRVTATFHRYVIDANRDPSGASLYPGQNTTDLVPLTNFDGEPIMKAPLADAEMARRRAYHASYHAALAAEIARVKAQHGVAILYDCHSIRSRVANLFDGVLPDLNIGTNNGATCAPAVEAAAARVAAASPFSHVVNGRFRGGWTTRHYGRPEEGVHAIQMELAQSLYLMREAPPFLYDKHRARRIRTTLKRILEAIAAEAPKLAAQSKGAP